MKMLRYLFSSSSYMGKLETLVFADNVVALVPAGSGRFREGLKRTHCLMSGER